MRACARAHASASGTSVLESLARLLQDGDRLVEEHRQADPAEVLANRILKTRRSKPITTLSLRARRSTSVCTCVSQRALMRLHIETDLPDGRANGSFSRRASGCDGSKTAADLCGVGVIGCASCSYSPSSYICGAILRCKAVHSLQHAALCCNVLRGVAMWCTVLQHALLLCCAICCFDSRARRRARPTELRAPPPLRRTPKRVFDTALPLVSVQHVTCAEYLPWGPCDVATCCMLQHIALRCNMLTVTEHCCNMLQRMVLGCRTFQRVLARCSALALVLVAGRYGFIAVRVLVARVRVVLVFRRMQQRLIGDAGLHHSIHRFANPFRYPFRYRL